MTIMQNIMTKMVIIFGFLCFLELSVAIDSAGDRVKSASGTSLQKNLFAPNSAVFKIPVSKTVNLDLRNANDKKISSELLKVLKEVLKNKDVKQEKVVLNVKPPKGTNTTFVKNFITLLRNETLTVDPSAVVGAKSTIFKKKNGEISNLRLTLYVVRQKKQIPIHQNEKSSSHKSLSPKKIAKPTIEEANINITKAENITATVESVLRELIENSTETEMNQTEIFLHLISSTNISSSQINTLKRSIKQFLMQTYPNSTISMKTRLLYRRSTHVSKLEVEIDIKPKSPLQKKRILPMFGPKLFEKNTRPLVEMLNMTVILTFNNSTTPKYFSISNNDTKSIENTTLVINYYLRALGKNITEKGVNKSYIILNISLSKRGQGEQTKVLEKSLKDLMHKDFPESLISINTKLIDNKNSSRLYTAMIIKPKQISTEHKLNVTLISSSANIQKSLNTLKKDLQNLVPYSRVLVKAQNQISEDLKKLKSALESQVNKVHTSKFPIDLRESSSSFTAELDKVLPQILSTVEGSVKPVTLEFHITIPKDATRSTMTTDVCSIVKTLTSRIPARTRFGDVNLEVTVLPVDIKLAPEEENSLLPVMAYMMPSLQAAPGVVSKPLNKTAFKLLNLTLPGVNLTHEINETLTKLVRGLPIPNEANPRNEFNISMIIPQNETDLSVENILRIITREINILFPYAQILIQAENTIAEDLQTLELDIKLSPSYHKSSQPKKNVEVFSIDLTNTGESIPQELTQVLLPLWSKVKNNRPMSFDLKLRPANDIQRGLLGNDICAIVDTLSKSLPKDIILNEIDLRITVLPDEAQNGLALANKEFTSDMKSSEETTEPSITSKKLELKSPDEHLANDIHAALIEFIEGLKNNSNPEKSNLVLAIPLRDNGTQFNVKDTMKMIENDLSKLVPYADIIIKSQKEIEDDLNQLEFEIELQHKKPRKKFRIELSESGDFVPEEVDEIVFDLRKSKNPFSFSLEMVIPESVDLEESSSEICSFNNIVINNIPKQSILSDTTLRVTVSPKKFENANGVPEYSEPMFIKPRGLDNEIGQKKISPVDKLGRSMLNPDTERKIHSKTENQNEIAKKLPTKMRSLRKMTRNSPRRLRKNDKNEDKNVLESIEPSLLKDETETVLQSINEPLEKKLQRIGTNTMSRVHNSSLPNKESNSLFSKIRESSSKIPLDKEIQSQSDGLDRSEKEPESIDYVDKNLLLRRKPVLKKLHSMELDAMNEPKSKEPEAIRDEISGIKGVPNILSIMDNKNGKKLFPRKMEELLRFSPTDKIQNFQIKKPYVENKLKTEMDPLKYLYPIHELLSPGRVTQPNTKYNIPIIRNLYAPSEKQQDLTKPSEDGFLNSGYTLTSESNYVSPITRKKSLRNARTKKRMVNEEQHRNFITSERNQEFTTSSQDDNISTTYMETSTNPNGVKTRILSNLMNKSKIKKTPMKSETHDERKIIDNDESKENEKFSTPNNDETKEETIPIRAYNNDQSHIMRYIENLDLSNSTNWDETIANVALSIVNIISRENETLELILRIKPPHNTTVESIRNTTDSVISSLDSALPNDIINVEAEVGRENGIIVNTEMKITVSPDNNLGRLINEEDKLQNKLKQESQLVQKLNHVLEILKQDVNETEIQDETEELSKIIYEKRKTFLRRSLYHIVSNISRTMEKNNSSSFNFNYSITSPEGSDMKYGYDLAYLLKSLLVRIMPFEEVKIELHTLKNSNLSSILQVSIQPRKTFTTSPIDLDDLNILDVESVLTKIISTDTAGLQEPNAHIRKIIIDFVFKTSHISSLNLDNIESAIEDVLQSMNLKGKLMTSDIKLGLLEDKDIIIHLPFKISLSDLEETSPKLHKKTEIKEVTTSKPLELISDLILQV